MVCSESVIDFLMMVLEGISHGLKTSLSWELMYTEDLVLMANREQVMDNFKRLKDEVKANWFKSECGEKQSND